MKHTHAQADNSPLSIEDEDAYAHIVMMAREAQGDAARRVGGAKIARACARRFLVRWFEGATFRAALKAAGCCKGDVLAARADADFRLAFNWIQDGFADLLETDAIDTGHQSGDGVEISPHRLRFAQFILERKRKEFRRDQQTGQATATVPEVHYTINLIAAQPPAAPAAPVLCEQSATTTPPPYETPQI